MFAGTPNHQLNAMGTQERILQEFRELCRNKAPRDPQFQQNRMQIAPFQMKYEQAESIKPFIAPRQPGETVGTPERVLATVLSGTPPHKPIQKAEWMEYFAAELMLLHKKKAFCGHKKVLVYSNKFQFFRNPKKVKYYLDVTLGDVRKAGPDSDPTGQLDALQLQSGWYFIKTLDKENNLVVLECQEYKTLYEVNWDLLLRSTKACQIAFEQNLAQQYKGQKWGISGQTGRYLASEFKTNQAEIFYEAMLQWGAQQNQRFAQQAPFSLGGGNNYNLQQNQPNMNLMQVAQEDKLNGDEWDDGNLVQIPPEKDFRSYMNQRNDDNDHQLALGDSKCSDRAKDYASIGLTSQKHELGKFHIFDYESRSKRKEISNTQQLANFSEPQNNDIPRLGTPARSIASKKKHPSRRTETSPQGGSWKPSLTNKYGVEQIHVTNLSPENMNPRKADTPVQTNTPPMQQKINLMQEEAQPGIGVGASPISLQGGEDVQDSSDEEAHEGAYGRGLNGTEGFTLE